MSNTIHTIKTVDDEKTHCGIDYGDDTSAGPMERATCIYCLRAIRDENERILSRAKMRLAQLGAS